MPIRFLIFLSSFLVVALLPVTQSLPESQIPDQVCESAEACFYRAASFSDEQPDQGLLHVERFRHVQEAYPGTIWAKRAGFRLGWALLEREPTLALDYLRAARKDFPLLEDHVLLKLGQALGRMGSSRESALTFEEALRLPASSMLKNEISYEAGFAWGANGQCQPAIQHLEQATSGDRASPHAPRAFFMLADCAARLERVDQAQQALREIWRSYPESPEAQAVKQIVKSGQPEALHWTPLPEDYYRRGQALYDLARFEPAIQDLQKVTAEGSHGPDYEQGLLQLGMAHVRVKQYPQAEKIFRRLLAIPSPHADKAAVWLAKVYLRQDRGQLLLKFRKAVPPGVGVNERARIQWLSGVWAEEKNTIQQAVTAYEDAYRVADLPAIKADALWRLGWLHYQRGAWEDAIESFRVLAATVSDQTWQNRASYWNARALERLGRNEEAQSLYRQVSTEWPMTYYGQLSEARLTHPLRAGREQGPAQQAMNVPESSALQTNVHFQRAMELLILNLREEATRELSVVRDAYHDQPGILYAVAQSMLEAEDYEATIAITKRYFQEPLARRRISFDSPLWRMAYPAGYLTEIRRYAASHVDPFLVAGIIREESLYNPKALSIVGAVGLMQLMPATANRVARGLGMGSVDREDLLNGNVNVRLGVAYVGELLRAYEGNLIQAVAAYNAGPDAVNRWNARFGDRDPDEFVELISYRETRRYVKRVMTSYRIYHALHSTTCSVFHLDRTC